MPRETYFPDNKEPHIHYHKGGATFTSTKHGHKDLVAGNITRNNNCRSVYDELIKGTEREVQIAQKIMADYLS